MEAKICIDTDFLANLLRGRKDEIDFIKSQETKAELSTTYVNLFELYYWAFKSMERENNLAAISALLPKLNLLNFSDEAAKKAGEVLAKLEREGKPIDFRDLFIGAIALTSGYSIKTKNLKHFNRIEGNF
ncbi:type II toxin-antitoxin system VapC family toxin [Candidatus Woesearchaeota archaeon]|nr:type II toxin-antitoxin system VapC family toxin [Candidatus Woesearchaeota archaeon]